MTSRATLAVVIATRDAPSALERTLEPLVLGPCRPDEIFVLDVVSVEGTPDLVAAFARRHESLRLVRRNAPLEPAAALSLALGETRARWLLLQTAGDAVVPEALARALALAREHASAGAVLARAATFDPAGAVASLRGLPGRASAGFESPARFRELTLGGEDDPLDHAVQGAALYRRDALAALGSLHALGPLALPLAGWALAAVHGAALLPEPLVDEQSPPSVLERALAEEPATLVAPLRCAAAFLRRPALASVLPPEDARRLVERLRARTVASARAALERACEVLGTAARVLDSGPGSSGTTLVDRALARLLERAEAAERKRLRRTDEGSARRARAT